MAERKKAAKSAKTKTGTKSKVQTKRVSPVSWKERVGTNVTDYFRFGESYTSLILGVLVVVITSILLLSIVHKRHTNTIQQTSSTSIQRVSEAPVKKEHKTYSVKRGDSLWSISENEYKSGYNWVDIAKANNLTDPGVINVGNTLIIPDVTPKTIAAAQVQPTPTSVPKVTEVVSTIRQGAPIGTISGSSYTVETGDYLWEIAVRAYGDGYRWVDIAKANNLTNPGMIFSGNTLVLPR